MRQFTSHIDFSLTKKRFEMMVKHYSPFRSFSRKIVLLPVIIVLTVMYCTNPKVGDDHLYESVDLYLDRDRAIELGIERRGIGIRFDKSTDLPFTGTQQLRYINNDNLYAESVYEDGVLKSSTRFDSDGNLESRFEYGYIDDKYSITRQFNENGILIFENVAPDSDKSLGKIKEWHPMGQIKFEMTYKFGGLYHGLMTLYDEEGEIVEQELYEDGELVQKIK